MAKPSFYSQLDARNKYILLCCFFVFAVNGLYGMILGSLLPLISDAYNLNNTISGGLISAHQVGNLIAGFIAGVLPLYLGRKKAVIFMCAFVVMGFLIMILTGNPVLLILGFLFTGLSRGSISNFNNTMVNEISNSSSAALIVIFSTKLTGDFGWKLSAIVIIVLAIISMILFSRMDMDESVRIKQKTDKSYVFIKDRKFQIGAGILFFYLCCEATINGWMVKYFIDSGIMSIQYAQMLASLLWVVILAGRLTTAFIGERIPKKITLTILSIGTVMFYLLLLSTRNTTTITLAIMGLGFSMAGIYPTTVSTLGGIIRTYPMSMGVLLMISGVGAIIMPIITGALADGFGVLAGMSAIIVATLMMLIFVGLYVFDKSKPSRLPLETP
ncbi:MAG: hypothetical protein CVV00_12030 [Firmicutes bacterium HGW-Firmicutes-5]|nr:MAG: hypothetical protein CVV00_12030 [Firmicutes bacterium HGW-Firmicutes-5]